jgi:hypothetical protein
VIGGLVTGRCGVVVDADGFAASARGVDTVGATPAGVDAFTLAGFAAGVDAGAEVLAASTCAGGGVATGVADDFPDSCGAGAAPAAADDFTVS